MSGRPSGTVLLFACLLLAPLFSGCFGGHASEWAYTMTGIRDAQKGQSGAGVTVAIIDTGLDANHSSLDHATVVWKDYVSNKASPYDDVGHGSHVAGIILGKGATFGGKLQGFDLKGAVTADKPTLIAVKAIRSDQQGSATAVANGITFSVQNKADIICLSLGSTPNQIFRQLPSEIQQAIDSAINQGILVVASAGNNGEDPNAEDVATPAHLELVIAVGAVGEDKRVAAFSAKGSESLNEGTGPLHLGARPDPHKKPEIVAPGVKIKSAWKSGDFAIASGTSQAAPFVCGALALLLQKCTTLRATNTSDMVRRVKSELMNSAEPLTGYRAPHDNAAGYGLLRADRLLDRFGPTC